MSREARSDEVERIKAVYAQYDASPAERSKRSPANQGLTELVRERDRSYLAALRDQFGDALPQIRALDVGCGSGGFLCWLLELGLRPDAIAGVDLLADRIAAAGERLPGKVRLQVSNAEHLPFPDGSFDLVNAWTVMSSILDPEMRTAVAAEMTRVLASGGAIGWYDIRVGNPSNPNTRAVTRDEIARLFPGLHLRLRSVTLLPPVARRLGPLTGTLYPVLASVPILRSHLVGVLSR